MALTLVKVSERCLSEKDERKDGSLVVMGMVSATPLCYKIPYEILK